MKKIVFLVFLFYLTCLYAAPVAYTNRASFLSAVTSPYSINFDDLAAGTVITNQTIMGITFKSPGSIPLEVINASTGVRYAMTTSTGTRLLSPGGSNTSLEEDDLELIFATPMQAFGMDIVFDMPDTASYVSASFYDASNNLIHQIGPHIPAPTGGMTFVGLITDTVMIKRVVIDDFDPSLPDDHIAYDSLLFSPVPEPVSMILMLSGMISLYLCSKSK